ncbi:hypothetical protein B0O99DRAFT_741217 [Bisporella sp. PMI_857]|nr:hypothetical protein B0O99DRAFT_741217 [Bisporella sp. PMI_857]
MEPPGFIPPVNPAIQSLNVFQWSIMSYHLGLYFRASSIPHRPHESMKTSLIGTTKSIDPQLDPITTGVKKITSGSLTDSLSINGVAFKKTLLYAGFEQHPKSFIRLKIVCLYVELELKAEKRNAEMRVEQVSEYQAIVDVGWQIIYKNLEVVYLTGAKVVLSKLHNGDARVGASIGQDQRYPGSH